MYKMQFRDIYYEKLRLNENKFYLYKIWQWRQFHGKSGLESSSFVAGVPSSLFGCSTHVGFVLNASESSQIFFRDFPLFPVENVIPPFSLFSLHPFSSFQFTRSRAGATGLVDRYLCLALDFISSLDLAVGLDTNWGAKNTVLTTTEPQWKIRFGRLSIQLRSL